MPVRPTPESRGFIPIKPSLILNDPQEFIRLLQHNQALQGVQVTYDQMRLSTAQMLASEFGGSIDQWYDSLGTGNYTTEQETTLKGLTFGLDESTFTTALSNLFSTTTSETTRQTRRYVDVPTPDEVLDDFETGFQAHINSLVTSGALSQRDAAIANDMAEEFFNLYLAELGQRAAKGEDIFTVVGTDADEQLIGTRPGEVTDETTKGTREEKGTTTTTGRPVGAPPSTDQRTEEQKTEFESQQKLTEEEQLVRRNRLAVVRDLSPMEFLSKTFTPSQLATFVQSRKGVRQRTAETRTGLPVSTPTRI